MGKGKIKKESLFLVLLVFGNIVVNAQSADNLTMAKKQTTHLLSERENVKRFSNSESPDILFSILTNMKECRVDIQTNFPSAYKVRFIDYWGKSVKVCRNLISSSEIDVSEFKEKIVIMNIMDSKTNRLLSSQVVNLKRRKYN